MRSIELALIYETERNDHLDPRDKIKYGQEINSIFENLSKNENRIIEKYRQADADIREEVLMILMDGVVPNKKTTRNDVNNRKNSVKGQQIGDNNQQHNHFASQQNSSINIENQHGGSIVGIKNK